MSRPKRGYVFMKGKKHFIYEGLNLIGRQKDATFIIPDINISHQHSVIVIIGNHHYLGDINSSNGTYLKQLKLCPMQLYELHNEDAIKFGLLDAKYFKLENDVDSGLEIVEKSLTQVDDNIFNMATQLYDIPATNVKQDVNHKLVEPKHAVSINDLPTQLVVDGNDSLIEDEANLISIDKREDISMSNILINDLPTQIVVHEKDDDSPYLSDVENLNADNQAVTADVIEDTIVNDNNSNDEKLVEDENSKESVDLVTMQPVSESQSQLFARELRRRVRNMIASSSDEECSASDRQRSHQEHNAEGQGENSNESLDLVTMQPVASQYFSSESQLHVHQLRNRIRNVIASSDDERSEEDSQQRRTAAKKKSLQPSSNARNLNSDDDETDVEAGMSAASPLMDRKGISRTNRNKPAVDTDSDGASSSCTDAEEELKRISADFVGNAMEKPAVTELDTETTEVAADKEKGERRPTDSNNDSILDDSDIIPTTQVTDCHRYASKTVSQATANLEASVPLDSSFDLILTSSPPPSVVTARVDRVDGSASDCDAETKKNEPTTESDNILDNPESQPTQLEVSFDEDIITGSSERDVGTGRPPNPLVNILETVASSSTSQLTKANESIEERLSKMFASQVAEMEKDDDSVFLVPTQIIKEQATFAVPTQKMIPAKKSAPQIKGNTSAAKAEEKKRVENEVKRTDLTEGAKEDDDIFLQPTQFISKEEKNNDDVKKALTSDDDIFLQPTQMLTITAREAGNITTEGSIDQPSTGKKAAQGDDGENVDIFLQPTQVISNKVNNTNEEDGSNEVKNLNISSKSVTTRDDNDNDDDIFLQPTQMLPELTEKSSEIMESSNEKDLIANKNVKHGNVDIFLQPTQMLTNTAKEADDITTKETIDEASAKKNVAQGDDGENVDIFLQPTQVITNKVNNTNEEDGLNLVKNPNISSESVTTRDENNDGDDIFLQSTQMLPPELSETSSEMTKSKNGKVSLENNDNSNDEIKTTTVTTTDSSGDHHSNRGKIDPASSSEKSIAPKDDEIFLQSTHQIEIIDEIAAEEQRSLKMKMVQNLVTENDVFSKPACIDDPSSRENGSIRIIENDIFSQPTQVLESSDKTINENESKSSKGNQITLTTDRSCAVFDLPATTSHPKQAETRADDAPVVTTEKKCLRSEPVETVAGGRETQSASVKRRQLRSKVESTAKRLKTRNDLDINEKKRTPSGRRNKRKQSSDGEGALSNATNCVPSSSGALLHTGVYVIREISDLADNLPDMDNNNSEDEFERKDKLKTPSPPKTPKRSKRNKPLVAQSETTTATRSRQKNAERAEVKATSDDITSAHSSAAASVSGSVLSDVNSATTPAKQRKVGAEEVANLQSVRQRSNRKIKVDSKEIIPSATEILSDSHETESSRMKQEEIVYLDEKNETTRKSDRNTRVKQKRSKKNIEAEPEAPSSDSSHKTDTDVGNTRLRKSRATRKAVERKSPAEEDESSRDSGNAAGIEEVKSRRGRVSSAAKEDGVKKVKDNKKIATAEAITATSTFIPNTPERTKRKLKPKVVFTMLDSPELETIIRMLGGFVVDSVDACTVLLTSSVKRSLKLLSAIGQGKPICSPKWLHESKKANAFLDPWDYILEDHEAEEKWDFSLKESLKRGGERKLLANCTFQIMVNTAQDVLKGSIECCGGKCVTRAPSKDNRMNFFVVASPENRSKYAKFLKEKAAPKIIAAEGIFDAVLRQELHFEDHQLT